MVLEDFSLERKAIINPGDFNSEIPGIPKVAISCYSFVTFERMLDRFDSYEQIRELMIANTTIPIYLAKRNGMEYVLFNCDVGAPMAVGCAEDIYQLGVDTIIIFGTCGVLDSDIDDCAIIIPDKAVRDEGTSWHYAPPADEIEVNVTCKNDSLAVQSIKNTFIALLEEMRIPYTKGKTWTTDAIYREIYDKMEKRKTAGCICVDMECSALAAAAQFRGKNMFTFFYAADNLDTDEWDSRSLSNFDKVEEKDVIAELSIKLADRIIAK
ncbi:MAG: nucleoside phosphorylase [Eubacterium sp.]|nr:nucleoside phosphorylase [Eubacterium sp.]